ncbi:NUDIX domain-containing protein [Leptothermofonsia sichuanensis E412]|uniref:bis(5'-nucleosyl)-tetraphosphatase n=1 Tax=Leptothermofonsia sichuanensis TaxID=2917832 RepID=UPI001CA7A846|nr:NUDIX domain-containing protein [Leptothermofonsia sichuanensis]QZZ21320.1 NUDIX domain-containing protein [Leptothermofonsia sichuanensis E412]
MAGSKFSQDEAFGIVPILREQNGYQFLLIQHHAGHWGFPKGHADPGESALEAACREFVEETGIASYSVLPEVTFTEQYFFNRRGKKFRKTVIYFPALVQSTTVKCQQEEIRAYAWVEFKQAIALMSFTGSRQVLIDVHHYLTSHSLA